MLERLSKDAHRDEIAEGSVEAKTMAADSETNNVEPESPSEKNPHAVAMGRLGGKRGGKARAEKLNADQRTEIARKAAQARWQRKTRE